MDTTNQILICAASAAMLVAYSRRYAPARMVCNVLCVYEALKNKAHMCIVRTLMWCLGGRSEDIRGSGHHVVYATVGGQDATHIMSAYYATDKMQTTGSMSRWLASAGFHTPHEVVVVCVAPIYVACMDLVRDRDRIANTELDDVSLCGPAFAPICHRELTP